MKSEDWNPKVEEFDANKKDTYRKAILNSGRLSLIPGTASEKKNGTQSRTLDLQADFDSKVEEKVE